MPISAVLERARALLAKKVEGEVTDFGRAHASFYETQSTADEFFSALVEGAFLVASADDLLTDDETTALAETINFVAGERLSSDDFSAMLGSFAEVRQLDGEEGRVRTLAEAIPDAAARREILRFAILVALCDGELGDRERQTLAALGAAFGIEARWVDDTVARIAAVLNGSAPSADADRPPPAPASPG
jgi:tellurite resistance protein